ncbi:hypothetical protein [Marilutibacter maris]|uniref:hypothetical protein n=1 Tax=Marilutibacter maris TaxID=1605891 RepID=UPI000DA977DA|nr:hypothetical protein [Lysobacter maris]
MPRRVLFIPVSGGRGGGELQRSLILARTLRAQGGDTDIRFLAHAQAPFPCEEFQRTPLPGSPTRSEPEVIAAIADFAPDLCVFDSTLRMSALRAARAAGSRTAYLSVRPNSRWRGLDPRKRTLLDAHWILAPERLGAAPPWPERLGRWLLRRTRFEYFNAVFEAPDTAAASRLLAEHGLAPGRYMLACPGGAGYTVDGLAPVPLLAEAGSALRTTLPVLVVDPGDHALPAGWIGLPRMPNRILMGLVEGARLNVVNGGGTLVQALTLGAPCLAIPMQEEQAQRIAAFAARDAVLTCAAERTAIATAWQDAADADLDGLRGRARALGLRNDASTIAQRIQAMLAR